MPSMYFFEVRGSLVAMMIDRRCPQCSLVAIARGTGLKELSFELRIESVDSVESVESIDWFLNHTSGKGQLSTSVGRIDGNV